MNKVFIERLAAFNMIAQRLSNNKLHNPYAVYINNDNKVHYREVAVNGISLNKISAELELSKIEQLYAIINPENSTNKSVTWSSSDTSIATVNNNGLVIPIGIGNVIITATSVDGNYSANCAISVIADYVSVRGVNLNKTSTGIIIGNSEQLIALISPLNATNKNVTWSSSDTSIATVSASGVVTAISNGVAIISATTVDGHYTDRCTVTCAASIVPVTSVSLNKNTMNLMEGDTEQLIASILPTNATNQNITWESNNPSIATVSNTGLVTAVSSGNVTITVTTVDGNKTATCTVSVAPLIIPVTGVSLNKGNVSIIIGNTEQLTATVLPINATNTTVTWESNNPDIATVSSTGLITAVSVGSAIISVTTDDGGFIASCSTNVVPIAVTGVSLNKNNTSIIIGNTEQLTATVLPANATYKTVTWSSSDTSIATVSSAGLVTAVGVGSATITVTTTDGNYTASCTTAVTPIAVTGISLNHTSYTLYSGESTTLIATITPSNATNKNVTWSTSDSNIISITPNGNNCTITFVSGGTATITATTVDGGYTSTCTAVAYIPVTGVEIPIVTHNLYLGETWQVVHNIIPSNATNQNVTWSSSDISIATVSSTGLVTAVSDGNAIITVTTVEGNYTATSSIIVKVHVSGISLNKNNTSIIVGNTEQLTATVIPANATNQNVSWSSSDITVAVVSSTGLVTAIGVGSATITATTIEGSYTATCTTVVTPVAVTGVSLNKNNTSIIEGDTETLIATIIPSNATNQNVTWSSSDTSIATVNSSGVVTAVSTGSAIITVTTVDGGFTASCTISVVAKPLTFNITSSGNITWKANNANLTKTIEYKLNNGNWTSITSTTAGVNIAVSSGDTIKFRGYNTTYATSATYYNSFTGSTAGFTVSGNIMSLIDSINYASLTSLSDTYTFYNLFNGCTTLTNVNNLVLPATTLASNCYTGMFQGCTSLTAAPVLPATTLVSACYQNMFNGCTSLTAAPALPATTLASVCYNSMFHGCTSLTTAPALPATTLATYCYSDMFGNCKSITTAPALPATTLAIYCYQNMFNGCTSLTAAPALPATTLATYCYGDMFHGCTSLTIAPELPATILVYYCYNAMFYNCTSLTTAPALPATTLAGGCYQYMFYGCTDLTTAPALPATTLTARCYQYMFQGCTSLNYIKCLATNISASSCTENWVQSVASSGTFVKDDGMSDWAIDSVNGIPIGWTTQNLRDQHLTFNITSNGNITWKASDAYFTKTIEYKLNNGNWTSITSTTSGVNIAVSSGDTILFRGDNLQYANNNRTVYNSFTGSTAGFTVSGNIMSLINSTNFASLNTLNTTYQSTFYSLFKDCTALTESSELVLPATTLSGRCYEGLFSGCSSMINTPTLPAITLATGCYYDMFKNCTSLTTVPSLNAPTLANECYESMFYGCTSLTTTPSLPATTLAPYCYASMFARCTSLLAAPSLNATTLASTCYQAMFSGCTSLITPPSLPATNLAAECYFSMFYGCTSLLTAPSLPATTLTNNCYDNMFNGCTSLTTAPSLPATTLAIRCYYNMFQGCTGLTTAPSLPATTLDSNCYRSMFQDCTSLTTAPSLNATTLDSNCYYAMFSGCTSLTTAPSLPATTLTSNCYYQMFYGCTGLTSVSAISGTTLARSCCAGMFQNCTSLVTGPELPATTLINNCYKDMFNGCTNLNYIKCLATDISATDCTTNWVYGVASSGTFVKDDGMSDWVIDSVNGIPIGWTIHNLRAQKYFTITSQADNNTISFVKRTDANMVTVTGNFAYSLDDGITWTAIGNYWADLESFTYNLNNNQSISIKGTLNKTCFGYTISSTQNFTVSGNIMSLVAGNSFTGATTLDTPYAFHDTFSRASKLTSAVNMTLGATTLSNYCYFGMFYECTSLVTPPIMPGTTLANNCYRYMFQKCTALTTPPILPATTMVSNCYYCMFYNCTALATAPNLPATALAPYCYFNMFYLCTSITTAPSLPATTMVDSCYKQMFYKCWGLTTAPSLNSTSLAVGCYENMFFECTSLTTAPSLSATTLVSNCYKYMFKGCSSLNYIECLATDISAQDCTVNWVNGVAATGTFVNASGSTWPKNSNHGIPVGWSETYSFSNISINSISVNPSSYNIRKYDTSNTITVNINPSNATNKYIYWTISNTSVIAQFCTNNEPSNILTFPLIGISAGSATITATSDDGNKVASCNITVT